MAAFSYNPSSSESHRSQYNRYLQNQNYVSQIDNAIRETGNMNAAVVAVQSREVQNAIHASSQEVKDAIYDAVSAICYDLEDEFENLNNNLLDIKYEIRGLSNLIGHGFSLLLEGQKITNLYLGKIQDLLGIPDSQKQRVYHIERGMTYLRNAFRESPDSEFYSEALEEFKKSEDIEKKDFFSLYHIGFIYLKSTKHLDEISAEKYFRSAARYYLAEAFVGGTNISNNLLHSHKGFLLEAVEAYLFAAEACYLQQKFSEAAQLASEAWKTLPGFLKAGFMQSKYLAADNQPSEAANVLEKVIEADRYISMDVLSDLDLISKPEIQDLFEELRQEAFEEASKLLSECKKNMVKGSVAEVEVAEIESLVSKKSFLHCKEAIDLLQLQKERTFSEKGFEEMPSFLSDVKRILELDEGCEGRGFVLEEFRESYLKRIPSYVTQIKACFEDLTENTQWIFSPRFTQYKIKKYQWESSRDVTIISLPSCPLSSKKYNSTLLEFLKQESEYSKRLPAIKMKCKKMFKHIISEDAQIRNVEAMERETWREKRIAEINQMKLIYYLIFAGTSIGGYFLFEGSSIWGIILNVIVFIVSLLIAVVSSGIAEFEEWYEKRWTIAFSGLCTGIALSWVF